MVRFTVPLQGSILLDFNRNASLNEHPIESQLPSNMSNDLPQQSHLGEERAHLPDLFDNRLNKDLISLVWRQDKKGALLPPSPLLSLVPSCPYPPLPSCFTFDPIALS